MLENLRTDLVLTTRKEKSDRENTKGYKKYKFTNVYVLSIWFLSCGDKGVASSRDWTKYLDRFMGQDAVFR